MASCLNPLTIKRPGLSFAPHSCPSFYWRDNLRPYFNDSIVCPCGKCINCLKNRQSSMVVRIKREAEKRGTLCFLTLTYDDDHLPLAQSLWSVDTETGEYSLESPAEIISSGRFPDLVRLGQIKMLRASDHPRYLDVPLDAWSFVSPKKRWFVRITPSVCREDVRLWIKRSRVAYKRVFGKDLDMSYSAVQEYGPRTCRPHVHLAIMGISKDTLEWLARQWTYGFTKVDFVNRVDGKHDDPWSGVAFYIGKYMSKGKFECQSVLDGASEKPRVCQSLGLGVGDFEDIKPYVCAFDIYGKYDLNTLYLETGKRLSKEQLDVLCEEIPKRLTYRLNDKIILPLPRLIRNKIFYNKDEYEKPSKTTIWYLVACALRVKFDALREHEFNEFLSANSQREMSEVVASFRSYKEACASLEATSREADLQEFYKRSLF